MCGRSASTTALPHRKPPLNHLEFLIRSISSFFKLIFHPFSESLTVRHCANVEPRSLPKVLESNLSIQKNVCFDFDLVVLVASLPNFSGFIVNFIEPSKVGQIPHSYTQRGLGLQPGFVFNEFREACYSGRFERQTESFISV